MSKTKAMCVGCRDDYYNGLGAKECWSFQSAKVVTKTCVGTWDRPPYLWNPQETLSCHSPEGLHWLRREDARVMDKAAYERVTATEESRRKWETS